MCQSCRIENKTRVLGWMTLYNISVLPGSVQELNPDWLGIASPCLILVAARGQLKKLKPDWWGIPAHCFLLVAARGQFKN